jgi:ADP-L-glycero-D-manno-heptose 6-epimerase
MILVTGGAGFIGSILVKYLNQLGHSNIIIVDRLHEADKWKNLRDLKYSEFIHADELFTDQFKISLGAVKKIYHMGACSSTTERDVDYLMKNNVQYSQKLFKIALENELPIVYASSAATYGDGELGYDDNHEGVAKLKPLNPYGYSKQFFDEWVLNRERKPALWCKVF